MCSGVFPFEILILTQNITKIILLIYVGYMGITGKTISSIYYKLLLGFGIFYAWYDIQNYISAQRMIETLKYGKHLG